MKAWKAYDLINRGKKILKRFDSLILTWPSKFSGVRRVSGEILKKVVERTLASGTHYGGMTEEGEQQIYWVPEKNFGKEYHLLNSPAKTDGGDAKNMTDRSTKITIFTIEK